MDSDNMYAIDRIEEDIVIAENIETKEQIQIKKEVFSFPIQDGTMFSFKDNIPKLEKNEEIKRKETLREKMERLKKHE